MGLYTPTILGGNSYLSWFYDRGAIKDPAHTGTSKGLSQAIKRGPIRKFLPNYANVYVTIQGHGLSAGARIHYVTVDGIRKGLALVGLLPTSVSGFGQTGMLRLCRRLLCTHRAVFLYLVISDTKHRQ